MFEEISDEEEVGGSSGDDKEMIAYSGHNSFSEEEGSDADPQSTSSENDATKSRVRHGADSYYHAKDKTTLWHKHPLVSKFDKSSSRNIVKILPRALVSTDEVKNEETAFMQFFENDMIEEIVRCTKAFIFIYVLHVFT